MRTAQELVQKNVLAADEPKGGVPDVSQAILMAALAAPTVTLFASHFEV